MKCLLILVAAAALGLTGCGKTINNPTPIVAAPQVSATAAPAVSTAAAGLGSDAGKAGMDVPAPAAPSPATPGLTETK